MYGIGSNFLIVGMFELSELMMGKVALFNMWDKEMTEDEVKAIDCSSEGNLLSMSDTLILGPSGYMPEEVPCETGKNIIVFSVFMHARLYRGNEFF